MPTTRTGFYSLFVLSNCSFLLPELRHNLLPRTEHLRVERNNALAGHFGRRRKQLREAIVDSSTRLRIETRKQMPERQTVAHARLPDHNFKPGVALGSFRQSIDLFKRGLKQSGRVLEIWSTRSAPAMRPAKR